MNAQPPQPCGAERIVDFIDYLKHPLHGGESR
jgi:hypothetical protein